MFLVSLRGNMRIHEDGTIIDSHHVLASIIVFVQVTGRTTQHFDPSIVLLQNLEKLLETNLLIEIDGKFILQLPNHPFRQFIQANGVANEQYLRLIQVTVFADSEFVPGFSEHVFGADEFGIVDRTVAKVRTNREVLSARQRGATLQLVVGFPLLRMVNAALRIRPLHGY